MRTSRPDRALGRRRAAREGEKEFGQGLAIVLRGFRAMLAEPSSLTQEQP